MNTQQMTTVNGYQDVILRAAQDPNFDVDKLERLVIMNEAQELRSGDRAFNEALSAAEAEMATISTDANNPQTRSRYATFARLDGAVRPIYTKHGFGISWNTEPVGEPNMIRIVGMLSNGIIARRFQVDMPIVTQGLRGGDMMTRSHATMSAITYGKRALEIMMFNLAIGDDDDGNRAGGARQPPRTQQQRQAPPPSHVKANVPTQEVTNPETGEVSETAEPAMIVMEENDDFRTWGEKFISCMRRYPKTIEEADLWIQLNQEELLRMKENKPALFKTLQDAMDTIKLSFAEGT